MKWNTVICTAIYYDDDDIEFNIDKDKGLEKPKSNDSVVLDFQGIFQKILGNNVKKFELRVDAKILDQMCEYFLVGYN